MEVIGASSDVAEFRLLPLLGEDLNLTYRVGPKTRRRLSRAMPWACGAGVDGLRRGTIMLAPSLADLELIRSRWPDAELAVMESFDPQVRAMPTSGRWTHLPRLIPDCYYPPGDGADTFGVTRRLHLEARPRLVYLGGYDRGVVLTRLLEMTRELFTQGGELVLLEGSLHRDSLAPVVKHLRLTEEVIFAPPLSMPETAGMLLGADAVLSLDGTSESARVFLSWAMAAGNPIVARHSLRQEALLGPGALWVYDDTVTVWTEAVARALQSQPLRETLAQRQMQMAEMWRLSEARKVWREFLTSRV